MGAMLGFGLGAIKEQFKTPKQNIKDVGNTNTGFKGFVDRAKSIISPGMNLSSEEDYNGNINPIRNVIPKETPNTNTEKQVNNVINNSKLNI